MSLMSCDYQIERFWNTIRPFPNTSPSKNMLVIQLLVVAHGAPELGQAQTGRWDGNRSTQVTNTVNRISDMLFNTTK